MASQKQIEANRLNAQKSTGPVTPEGKAKSRFNALKAGIDADAEVIPGEDPSELAALANEYYQRFLPDRPEHYALVDALITNDWLLRRLRRIEGQLWRQEVAKARERSSFKPATPLACALPSVEDSLTRLQRRMDAADRAYHRALNQIRRLQQAALKPFDLEPLPDRPAEPPAPAAQPPSNQENQQPGQPIGFVPSISIAAQSSPVGAGLSLPVPGQSAARRAPYNRAEN